MMRGVGVFAAVLFATSVAVVSGHPLCYFDDRPTDYTEVLTFCPAAEEGACCNDAEEVLVEAQFNAMGNLTGDCIDLYTEVSRCEACFAAKLLLLLLLLLCTPAVQPSSIFHCSSWLLL